MKSVPTQVKDAIRKDYAVYAQPRLIADWNNNRYYAPTADNIPSEVSAGFDVEMFPIESICMPNRPTKGIAKARIGQSIISDDYASNASRFYIGSVEDTYKYWTSPVPTDASGKFPLHTDGDTVVRPFVKYSAVTKTNKIVIKLENSWATPLSYDIRIQTTVGGAWSTISTAPTIRNDGQIIIYYNGTGWSSTKPATTNSIANVAGVMFRVNSLTSGRKVDGTIQTYDTYATPPDYNPVFDANGNVMPIDFTQAGPYTRKNTSGASSNFDLIAIEAHLEQDLSNRLISVNNSEDVGEASYLYPIGTVNTNVGEITFSNDDGLFNRDNASSMYANILEGHVNFNLEYVYTVGGTSYSVQQFNLYGAEWTGQKTAEVTVSLEDFSKYFNTAIPTATMYENRTASQIMVRLMDSCGFVNYKIDVNDPRVINHTIPVFWCDGEKSLYEVLDELAQATQSAMYFDAYGVYQIKTREAAFDNTATPVWTLRGENSGLELADIVELDETDEFEANNVTVTYQKTDWSPDNNGQPTLQTVWEPDSTIVLRANQLSSTMGATDTKIWFTPSSAKIWPYTGIVNIESEIISYDGKEYVYYTGPNGGVKNVAVVKTADEKLAFDTLSGTAFQFKNYFTGALIVSGRGLWNSEQIAHKVDANGYNVRSYIGNNHNLAAKGFTGSAAPSIAQFTSTIYYKDNQDVGVATHGQELDFPPHMYGTRVRFKAGDKTAQRAGVVLLNNGSGENGIYVDVTPTLKLSAAERALRNEVVVYSRYGNVFHTVSGMGAKVAISEEKWYDIDVYYTEASTYQRIKVYIDGVSVIDCKVIGGERQPKSGKFGMYIRGQTEAQFEYLYAISRDVVEPADDVSYFDMVHSGYAGGMWDREWTYGWSTRTRRIRGKNVVTQSKWNQKYFDDFGAWAHEIREYDVKFDPNPVLHSRLFMTDEWNAVVLDYRANPFGAKWTMANAARGNAVINGDDTTTFEDSDTAVSQSMLVFGRPLIVAESETIVVKDDASIQKRGKIDVELTSDWIQSKDMAQSLADWIVAHWSQGQEQVSVTVFGNPLFELTDVVSVAFLQKNMLATTHKFYVVGISTEFSTGISTTLTLRRVR